MTAQPSPRLLILEDDQRLAAMVATYLSQNGFDVARAETAVAGLKLLLASATTDRPFSILLLDVIVPDGNGLESADASVLCRQLMRYQS